MEERDGSATASTSDVLQAYRDARAQAEDETWASRVLALSVTQGVRLDVLERELWGALELVRESGEPAEDLYGPAQEWAQDRIEERVARGQRVVDSVADTEWRDVPVVGSVVAGILSLLILAVWWARDGLTTDYTAGLLLLPVASGFGIILALATWERVLRRHSWTIAVTIGLVLAAVGVGLLTWLVWGTRGEVVATGSVFWLAALSAAHFGVAALLERVLQSQDRRPRPRPVRVRDDEEWERDLAGALRFRLDLREAQVRDIVREARAHTVESGRSLEEDFGAADGYAASFPRDRRAAARRIAWARSAMVLVAAFLAFGGLLDRLAWAEVSWVGLTVLVLAGGLATSAWRRYLAEG